MLLAEIGRELETRVPSCYAEDWDSVGWMIAPLSEDLQGILICVDPSPEAFRYAFENGHNLVIAHHPLFFDPLDRLREDIPLQNMAMQAVRENCGVYAMHTNADSCAGGLNDLFAGYLGLGNCRPLLPSEESPAIGLGRVGELATAQSCATLEKKLLAYPRISYLRSTACLEREFKNIALCTGSGGDLITEINPREIDLYITGDVKHHQVEEARLKGLELIIVDHYEMETVFLDFMHKILLEDIQYDGPVDFFVRRNPYRHRVEDRYLTREEKK
ncbi:MAG: Nif3-like dinuclear metal center hexameric protein [bacterium]